MKNSIFSCFNMKQLSLLAFLLFTVQAAMAGDNEGYYWFRNHVTAYPTGAGQVYGTYSEEDFDYDINGIYITYSPHDELFTDEVMIQACYDSPDVNFYVFSKPAEGYNFNGWYSLNKDGIPDKLYVPNNMCALSGENNGHGLFGFDARLGWYNSEDNETEYYDEAPINEIAGVFGRVNYSCIIDNIEEVEVLSEKYGEEVVSKEDIANPDIVLLLVCGRMHLSISNPANEISDMLVLKSDQEYIHYTYRYNEEYDIDEEVEDWRLVFAGWTDPKGNRYDSNRLNVTVTEKETYTAHYNFIYNEDYLEFLSNKSTPISDVIARCSNVSSICDLNGRVVSPCRQQGGIYIRGGKKYMIPCVQRHW